MIRIDQFIPNLCLLCQELAYHRITNLCQECLAEFPFSEFSCQTCAMPLHRPEQRCGVCLNQNLSYDQSFAAFLYQGDIRTLLNLMKHQQNLCALPPLSTLFCERFLSQTASRRDWTDMKKPDLLIPIPLSRKRYIKRAFNQSNELGKLIAKTLSIPYSQSLIRRIETSPQQGLGRKARLKNLKNGFCIDPKYSDINFEGKIVALMDDVITTGATMESAAKVLKKHGAKQIYAWSIARTALD